ncbi:hypothetical protein BVX93_01005 [bacterium B13(2017)]|nr:hypothetical protein BVX93_01005 [bacterium B13(2017)]
MLRDTLRRFFPDEEFPLFMGIFFSALFIISGLIMLGSSIFWWHNDPRNYILLFFGLIALILGIGTLNSLDFQKLKNTNDRKNLTFWICPQCKTENTSEHVECWKCHQSKP